MHRRVIIRLALWFTALSPFDIGWLSAEDLQGKKINEATLQALAITVLPESIGIRRITEIIRGFRRWLNGYKAGAEMSHGYVVTQLQITEPNPEPTYIRQLNAFEKTAQHKGQSFADLNTEERKALVAEALKAEKITELPQRPNGRHIVTDLMSFYFQSSKANDLCYGAQIGQHTCRGLPDSESAPRPLQEQQT